MQVLRHSLRDLESDLLRRGTIEDVTRLTWHLVEPTRPFVGNWHIGAMSECLEALYQGEIDNLRISIPPGHMKSLMVGVFWPIWIWLRNPGMRFMFASFDPKLTARDAQRTLDVYESRWFQERIPSFSLKRENGKAPGKLLFHNAFGGWRMATSIAGKALGNHVDFMGVDDPTKPRGLTEKGLSEAREWWKGTASTRMTRPGKGRVVSMQRLHTADLCEYLEQDPSFFHLVLPAHYNPTHPFVYARDPRKVAGELLWPEYRDEASLVAIAKDLEGDAQAQLEQHPSDSSTAIFKLEYFGKQNRWTAATLPPYFEQVLLSIDCSFKDEATSDFVVIAAVGTYGPYRYLLKLVEDRADLVRTLALILEMCAEFPEASLKLIEDKANGPAVISVLKSQISGLVAVEPMGSKVARAQAMAPTLQTGHWLIPDDEEAHPWVAKYVDQMHRFPRVKNDDMVDVSTQAANYLQIHGTNIIEALLNAKAEQEKARVEVSQNAKALSFVQLLAASARNDSAKESA